jgi:RNA polymerase sigma-70 factor (ECF subfamily)
VADDVELYRRWKDGDSEAAQALVTRHYDSVVRFFRTKVGPNSDDLVQRTFLACSEGNFRGDSKFRTYLFGVARNILLEFFRGRRKDAAVEPDFSESSVHDLDPGVSTVAAQRADQRLLVAALQRLPVEIQITLELYYWEGMGVAELAQVLEIPAGTVKSRLFRGRTLLKEQMELLPATPEDKESVRVQFNAWVDKMRLELGG